MSQSAVGRNITVMVVDDHPLLREGIASALQAQGDMQLVAEAVDGRQAVELFRVHRPDVTLMDVQMRGMNGIEALQTIRDEFPQARVIMLTTFRGDAQLLQAIRIGASGYLLKETLRKELLDAIRAVHAGGKRIPADLAIQLAEHVNDETLSSREIEVLHIAARGGSNKRIAADLSVAEGTVKAHMKNIMGKLSARDRTHAVTIAIKRGIIEA